MFSTTEQVRESVRDYITRPGVQKTPVELVEATLDNLSHVTGKTMWDVGSGSGAIAIEWKLSRPNSDVYAIERFEPRCFDIFRNAETHHAAISIVNHEASEAILDRLPRPDMIFLGCPGESDDDLCPVLWRYLNHNGWIASNAVSSVGVSRLKYAQKLYGGTITLIDKFDLPRVQWTAQKI